MILANLVGVLKMRPRGGANEEKVLTALVLDWIPVLVRSERILSSPKLFRIHGGVGSWA